MTAARHRKTHTTKAPKTAVVSVAVKEPRPPEKNVPCPTVPRTSSSLNRRPFWLGLVGLGLVVYGLSRWQIDPRLLYHAQAPVFFLDANFVGKFFLYPGGFIQGLASVLLQFYINPWLGALINTLLVVSICAAGEGLLFRLELGLRWLTPWFVVPLFLLLQSHYEQPWMEMGLGLGAALGGANAYLVLKSKPVVWRVMGFVILWAPLYYFSGSSSLLYGLLCGLCELLRFQSWLGRLGMGLGFWGASALPPLLANRGATADSAPFGYGPWLPTYWSQASGYVVALGLFFPLLLLAHAAIQRLSAERIRLGAKRANNWQNRLAVAWRAGPTRPGVVTGAWLTLILLLVLSLPDRQKKMRLAFDYYAQQQEWEQVVKLAPQITNPDPALIFDLNRALAHTGRLLEDMFSFPQREGWDFWFYVHDTFDTRQTMKASDALFELGQVNHAERMASEDLELNGEHPAVLQRLALINVLKGKPKAAKLFLNLLAQTVTHRAWARNCLQQLEKDPALSLDPRLGRIRSFMLAKDYDGDYETEARLYQLLRQNPKNRLAFDYLMAHYLLTGQTGKVAQHLAVFNAFGEPAIPRHCEEAILMHDILNKNQPINLHGATIRAQTRANFDRFNQVIKNYSGDLSRALPDLKRDFGNTFWFYRLYRCSAAMVPYVKFQIQP